MAQGQAFEADAEKAAGQANSEPQAPAKRYLESTHEDALVKVKIDGQEQELSIKELKRLSSLERASQKRMADAARIQQEHKQLMQSLKENPAEALKLAGRDHKKWAEEVLAREYELAQLSPEQRENLELKSRIAAAERADLESKAGVIDEIRKLGHQGDQDLTKFPKEHLANYRDHLANVNAQAEQGLQKEMIDAWEETKLPKHKTWANWMAMEMMGHEKRTGEPLSAKDAAVKVKADYQKFNRHLLTQMDAPAIHDWLGKEIVEKLMAHRIQSVTTQAAQGFTQNAPAQPASIPEKGYMNEREYRAWLKT
jgi:hypothetical protein